MADNFSTTALTVAGDDIGGVFHQRVKMGSGADGSYNDVSDTNPLPVGQPGDIINVTPTLDTSAYAAGDVLFATTLLASAVRVNDGKSLLQSLAVIDKDDQKPAFKIRYYSANVTSGAANGVPSISDADAANFLGSVSITAADYDDQGGVSEASIKNIGLMLKAASGTTNVYMVGVISTAGTFTASGLVLRHGLLYL